MNCPAVSGGGIPCMGLAGHTGPHAGQRPADGSNGVMYTWENIGLGPGYIDVDEDAIRLLTSFSPSTPGSIECPRCGAPPGEACYMLIGVSNGREFFDRTRHVSYHRERRANVR